MTPTELKEARRKLGLSVNQMAALLEVRPVHVRRMELAKWHSTHRRVMPMAAKLVQAWLAGFRPSDWPENL